MKTLIVAALAAAAFPAAAHAEAGLGDKVYGATVDAGVSEVEVRYGRLVGDEADGEDAAVVEFAHGFSDRFYGAVLLEFEREPGEDRKLEAVGFEGIAALGRIDAIDTDIAVYGEYEAVRNGADAVETKLLLQHERGPFDGRLNLIVEKELEGGEPLEFGYAASADWASFGEFRIGAEAFGGLGTSRDFLTRSGHFAGPMVKTEIEHLPGKGELEIEAAYLFALGEARHETDGQARLLLEYEFRF
jgi:hypothetical protein